MSAADGDVPPVTPMATQAAINDDISSMSGVSSPAEGQQHAVNAGVLKQIKVCGILSHPATAKFIYFRKFLLSSVLWN